MSVNWENTLLHPIPQTTFIGLCLDCFCVDAGLPDCGMGGEDTRPTTVCQPWGKFDHPDMVQAAGEANSGLSNHTIRPAASTASTWSLIYTDGS